MVLFVADLEGIREVAVLCGPVCGGRWRFCLETVVGHKMPVLMPQTHFTSKLAMAIGGKQVG